MYFRRCANLAVAVAGTVAVAVAVALPLRCRCEVVATGIARRSHVGVAAYCSVLSVDNRGRMLVCYC